jgi:periplasmic protein TonB
MKVLRNILILLFALSFTLYAQDKSEKMPSIKGGMCELTKNIKYPEAAKKDGVKGKVLIKAVIDENGNVVESTVVKGVTEELNTAAIKAVEMTKFVPGVKNGINVKTEVTIPINFKLDDCCEKS